MRACHRQRRAVPPEAALRQQKGALQVIGVNDYLDGTNLTLGVLVDF